MNVSIAAKRSATQGPSYSRAATAKRTSNATGVISAPSAARSSHAASKAVSAATSPKKRRESAAGTAIRSDDDTSAGFGAGIGRAKGSAASNPATTSNARHASPTVSAKIDTQSSVRQAGTMPRVETRPRLGLSPTRLFRPAGTRPEPAVSVPSASETKPRAVATADPELDPPGIRTESKALRGAA